MDRDTGKNDNWEIKVVEKLEDIESIRPVWEEMQRCGPVHHPDADINRYLVRLESIKKTSSPYIILFYRDSQPEAMLIGRIGGTHIPCRIGHVTLLRLPVRSIRVDHGGFLGNFEPDICSMLVDKLYDSFRKGEANVAIFDYLPVDSAMYRLVREKSNIMNRGHFSKIYVHWRMSIPENMDIFYQKLSKKHRDSLKRKIKRLEKEHNVEVVTYSREDELEEAISNAMKVSVKTYQYVLGPGSGFIDNVNMRSMLTTSVKQGWFRMHILFIDKEPCAFQQGLQYHKTYLLGKLGFDPEWKKWGIGSTLFLKVLENLCHDPAVEYMDFGFGDEDYKKSYGDECWDEAMVYIFAPRFYPVCVNLLHSLTAAMRASISYLARKTGFESHLKRWWHKWLIKGSQ